MVHINKERLVNEFMELVSIDSETGNEGEIANVLKEKFSALGLEVLEDRAKEITGHGANNLICRLKGNVKEAAPIFFATHMDTVTPGVNIKPSIENNYIVSDGTTILGADDKAGIAAMLEAVRVIQEEKTAHGDTEFIVTVGEELGLKGAKALDTSLVTSQFGYALDSDGPVGNIVNAAPYQAKIFAKVLGKKAHAGVAPEKGVSAITVAAKAISKMTLGRIDEETTANIGYFKGGKLSETNIVCDFVEIEAEARSLNETKLNQVTSSIKEGFESIALQFGGEALVDIELMYPGFFHPEDASLVQVAQQAAQKLHLPSEVTKSGGGSDANILNGYNLPTVNLSVGYEYIHTTKERIHIDALMNVTKMVVQIMQEVVEER